MHVIHVVNSVDLRSGGPIYAMRDLIAEQLCFGHNVSVIATDMQAGVGGIPRQIFHEKVRNDPLWRKVDLTLLPSFGRGRPWNHLGWAPSCFVKIPQLIKRVASDQGLVHVHGVFSLISSMACAACRKFNVPYVVEPYGVYDPHCFESHFWILKRVSHWLIARRDLNCAAAVKAASQFEAKFIRKLVNDADQVRVIPYGVHVPSFSPEHCIDADPKHPVVGFMSRITKKKRPEWVVRACAMLRSSCPKLRLRIAGSDDGHRKRLEHCIRECGAEEWVTLYSFLEGESKTRFFHELGVFVLPSEDESLGAVVLEAMAHGVPVVVTPGVASHIYVDASGCGLTVEDSIDGVTEGIRRLLQADKSELGRRGREYVEKHLTWPAVAKQVDDLYESVLRPCRKE